MIRVMRPPARLSAHPSRAGVPPWELAALLLLLALCVALRVARLGALPIFVDESLYTRATQIVATGPVPGTLLVMASPSYGGNPPLFSWLAAPLTRLILDPLLATRLASALIGTLGMLGTWAVGRALWGPAAALLAGLFYTLCPYLLFYNRLALLDGLVATCGAWTLLFAITLSRRGRVRDAAALGLCLAAALLTKILAVDLLLLPLLAIATAPCGRRSRVARGAALAVALGVLPFLVVLSMPYDNTPAAFALHGHLQTGGGAARLVHTLQSQAGVWETALWLYLTPPILLLGVLGLWAARRDRAARLVGLWAVLGSLPIVLVPNRLFVPRHFLYIAVPILLLAARGAGARGRDPRLPAPSRAPVASVAGRRRPGRRSRRRTRRRRGHRDDRRARAHAAHPRRLLPVRAGLAVRVYAGAGHRVPAPPGGGRPRHHRGGGREPAAVYAAHRVLPRSAHHCDPGQLRHRARVARRPANDRTRRATAYDLPHRPPQFRPRAPRRRPRAPLPPGSAAPRPARPQPRPRQQLRRLRRWKILLVSGMDFFTDAYDLFIIGVVVTILKPIWRLSSLDISLVNSTALIASTIGAVLFGRIADMLGRKRIYDYEALVLAAGAPALA